MQALSTSAWLTCAGLLIGGASWVLTLSLFNVTVQLSTPRWVVGRALSLYQMATFGGMALGGWLWGSVAEAYGPAEALLASAVLMLVGAAIGLFLKLPDHAALNLDPLNRWREPNLALDLKPRRGPIVIAIEYVIREADLHDFLDAMAERRRIRRRDGARRLDAGARSRKSRDLGRDLSDADLARIYQAQSAHDAFGCGRRGYATAAAQRRGADQGASHDRASDGLGGVAGSAQADAGYPRLVVTLQALP